MQRCIAHLTNNLQCTFDGTPVGIAPELTMCGRHTDLYRQRCRIAGDHIAGTCLHYVNGRHNGPPPHWCGRNNRPGEFYCQMHHMRHVQAEVEDRAEHRQRLRADEDEERRLAAARAAGPLAAGARLLPPGLLGLPPPRAGIVEPPAIVRMRELAVLAGDNQNVHTREVNEQTEDGIRRLCAIPIPATQDTRRILMRAWTELPYPWENINQTIQDVSQWFNTIHCRTAAPHEPDKLYRHTMRGLVAYINRLEDAEVKAELFKRTYQECFESIGMCCDGHLARLVNVLVGFDDAFRPPVSRGEVIQNQMAAIVAMTIPAREKVRLANVFFDEMALAPAERVSWLDALMDEDETEEE